MNKLKGKYLLMSIILLLFLMFKVVDTTRSNLINIKNELIQLERGEISRSDAIFIPDDYNYSITSEGVQISGAYVWSIPFLIVIFILIILYIVKYLR